MRTSSLFLPLRAGGLVALILVGCRERPLPTEDDETPTPLFSQGAPPTVVTVPGPQQYNTVAGPVSFPGYATPALVRITASGNIQVFKNWPPPEAGTEFATIPPPGDNQGLQTMNCYGQVTVWFQWTGTVYLGPCNGPILNNAVLVHGTGSVQRGSPYPGSTPPACGQYPYTPCYSYSGGSQSVTITPVAADLQLAASAFAVAPGQALTFTTSVTPAQVESVDVPCLVQGWRWVPDAASNAPNCGVLKACTFQPTGSGTMHVDALVNHSMQTKSIHVQVIECP